MAVDLQPRQLSMGIGVRSLTTVGLFAGIGGIELGLARAGHRCRLLCEIDPGAQAVLSARFPDVETIGDVRRLDGLPSVDLLAAGFPCQDLSQAGRTAGIGGKHSGLVGEVFRLIRDQPHIRWLLLENVPFMLSLDQGRAMRYLTSTLAEMGYTWAYRTVDTRAFGLPHRRRRVLLLASRTDDPRGPLFSQDADEPPESGTLGTDVACGFYWTEGLRGLGWALDGVPTLKGGSTIGIPSAPAIWLPDGRIVVPEIRDAERLQGFAPDWTLPANPSPRLKRDGRWRLVGNAVSVPVAEWLGRQVADPPAYAPRRESILSPGDRWPHAAWGVGGHAVRVDVSAWPLRLPREHLADFLAYPLRLLSERATAGFLGRAEAGSLRFPAGFLDAVREHLKRMRAAEAIGDGTAAG